MAATDHSNRFEEFLPAYALGALDGDERRELEEHLAAGCAECERQIVLWQGGLEALAETVPAIEPSEVTRARVLRLAGPATAAPAQVSPSAAPRRLAGWQLAAAAVLLGVGLWGWIGQARLRDDLQRLAGERDRLAQRVANLDREVGLARSEAQRATQALQVIASPGVQSVVLAGLGPTPGAVGHAYVNPRSRDALFYAFDLPRLAPDKSYQLWFIAGGKPVSAGVFDVDERGAASLRVDRVADVRQIEAWAVTIEPKGGVPRPTGAMVLKGA
ncbi:MAG: anti-sigma factor domain-containing protein [Thermoanaerobaculia bacterium]